MHFPDPLKAKITKDGKFRLSVKLTDEVIVTRDVSLDVARAFLAAANALVREHESNKED